MLRRHPAIFLAAGIALAMAGSPARAADCDLVNAAFAKLDRMPYHAMTVARGHGPGGVLTRREERIYTGDALYDRSDGGAWHKSGKTGIALTRFMAHPPIRGDATCRLEGTATIGNEPVTVVSTSAPPSTVGRTTLIFKTRRWISRRTGLPLREETVLSNANARGPTAMETTDTYAYDHVRAPR